ncbi:MFS general substrate transporter isoform C [Chlorella sorokiniana]|nr:MFS general substrate transporter isoform C [Chlorella sorokiniana]|eukprot:PRW32865.1 MFS general substrate transporter isoform C [Chlorella sorokiniana]
MVLSPITIFLPALYIFASVISFTQFKVVYGAFARLALTRSSNPLWQQVQPVLRQLLTFCEAIFGQPATFTPNTTHVLLVAIMIVLLVNLRR